MTEASRSASLKSYANPMDDDDDDLLLAGSDHTEEKNVAGDEICYLLFLSALTHNQHRCNIFAPFALRPLGAVALWRHDTL